MKFLSPLLLSVLLSCAVAAYTQPNEITYSTLEPIDSITDRSVIKKMQRLDKLNNPDFFFYKDENGVSGFSMMKKGKSKWYKYYINIDGPNAQVTSVKQYADKIIGVEVVNNYAGTVTGAVSYMLFINVSDNTAFAMPSYYCEHRYDEQGETASFTECKTLFEIKGNLLKVTATGTSELSDIYCPENAEYRIEPARLVQTKYQGRGGKNIYPVKCLEDVCTGIDIDQLRDLLPGTWTRDVPLYEYGYDSEELGKEVYRENELLFFATVPYGQVRGIVVVSPQYSVSGYSTAMTVQQILEKHQEAKLRRDLIAEWEYFYLKEEGVRLIFMTDETNRIGVYDTDPESESIAIRHRDKVVDYVELH